MTQPPYNPYPQQYPYGYSYPAVDPLATARKGGLLLIILGVVGLLFGGCFAASAAFYAAGKVPIPPESPMAQMDPKMVAMAMYVVCGIALLISLAMLVIGIFARRGSVVACILGIVACALVSVIMLLWGGGAVMQGGEGLVLLPIVAVALALFGLAIHWLIQGTRAALRAPQLTAPQPHAYPPPGYSPQQPQSYNPYAQPMQGYYAPPPQQQQQQQQQSPPPPDRNA